MMLVGDCLKQARIKSNLTLESASKELYISFGYLTAIENNEISVRLLLRQILRRAIFIISKSFDIMVYSE